MSYAGKPSRASFCSYRAEVSPLVCLGVARERFGESGLSAERLCPPLYDFAVALATHAPAAKVAI
ncbi:MAG: hypothetical protein D6691_09545 [Candidatus Hydrogenedentota bacterium]|uniref:Uncharacterized protein n=1 Tax=Sumerlaea chitinivorans TaxID=2250252 RepID=A0A2Z4Y7S2_SUMC1|nr:hypothetical protein BRCON_2111 [Candidatus Sumerlaea chitinivorans]RMH25570.1 MAG: hypothetical protein D6691_09545 [Candidatus Hydrogenedentota bacterium]